MPMSQQTDIKYLQNISYPGMCRKSGVLVSDKEYILKFSETEAEQINLYSELMGALLCKQLQLRTSNITLIEHNKHLCLLSEKWELDKNEQYFPLASYYEELLDTQEQVPYTYSLFKNIIKQKVPNDYETILETFWGMFIVDFLICNSRSAGNIGFLHNDIIRLAPIFDCSTELEYINDNRYKDFDFPVSLMHFDCNGQSFYYILTEYKDSYKAKMLEKARKDLNLNKLPYQIKDKFSQYIFDVVSYRFNKLISI